MSFLEGLKKVIQGKPVYEAPIQASTDGDLVTGNTKESVIKVYVQDTDSKLNGDRLDTYCRVKNDSIVNILLDKIRILGGTTEIDETLKPGESKQVKVYSGSAPSNNSQHDAELQYRTETGIYYKARHDVQFKAEGNLFIIERLPYENTSKL